MNLKLSLLVPLAMLCVHASVAQNQAESYKQSLGGTTLSFDMVAVPGGEFTMGSKKGNADEQPVHKVKVDPFWIGAYEVTWDIYEPFLYKDYEASHSSSAIPANVDAVTRPTKPYLDMTF